MTVLDKLDEYLQTHTLDEEWTDDFADDDVIIERACDLIESLDPDNLSEDQLDIISEMLDLLAEEDDEFNEAFVMRKRRDIAAMRKRRREYRRKRALTKLKMRKYRRSAKGRKTLRKAKRFAKVGRTSTMKRRKRWIGPKI
jgi:hypothetical protein